MPHLLRLSGIDLLLIVLASASCAWLAAHFGWLNVDAWNYLALAENLAAGDGLSIRPDWGHDYWAIFPGGYPLLLVITQSLLPVDMLAASKILNGLLTLTAIFCASRFARIPLLVSAAVFFSAAWLEVASYSWSENMFVCFMLVALLSMDRYLSSGLWRWLGLYVLALVLTVSSRYIAGFYLVAYVAMLVWYARSASGSRVVSVIGATVVAAFFFVGYLLVNRHITGHLTGFGRAHANETVWFLLSHFLSQSVITGGLLVVAGGVVLLVSRRAQRFAVSDTNPAAMAMVIGGVLYLALLFALRMHSRFELFGNRMVMPGLLLLVLAALSHLYACLPARRERPWLMRALFLLCVLANTAFLYRDVIVSPQLWHTDSYKAAMARYDASFGALPEGTAVIEPSYPVSGWRLDSPAFTSKRLFLVQVQDYPFELPAYKAFLRELHYHGTKPKYVFDFEAIATIEELERVLKERCADPALASWIKAHFSPKRFVTCHDCLTKP